jgi:DNA repair protein SbcD/Mre11
MHTADLHLTEKAPERWAALEQIVALAHTHQVSALLIAGDLFDHNVEADKLRPKLRAVLAGAGFKTIVLPGNHDHKAYRSGLYFGDNVTVISNWSEPLRLGDLIIWGLPYEKISGEDLVGRLRSMGALMNPQEFNILLYHGELLDAYFSRHELGDEGDQRYMPARLSYFEQMPLQHVLAGHFHSRYAGWQLPGGGLFIYPGSPVAVTRREIGRRVVNLLDHSCAPVEVPLDSYHYEAITLDLDPFSAADPLLLLEQRLQGIHSEAKVLLTVQGLFNGSALGMHESELAYALREKAQGRLAGEPVEDFYDVQHVLEDDLFRQFKTILAEKGCSPEQMEQVTEMAIRAFRVVKACS